MAKQRTCFVIAPIGEEGSPTRDRSDQILKYILEPAATECGYETIRADSIPTPGMITRQIIEQVIVAPMVIADLTGYNPNVFYELAVRHAARRPCVQVIERGERIPFDIGNMRVVYVTNRDLALAEKAREDLVQQIKAAEAQPDAFDNPVSTTLELRQLQETDRPIEQAVAQVLETVQRIERVLSDRSAVPFRSQFLDFLREGELRGARTFRDILDSANRGLPSKGGASPITDVRGGPKSA